MRLGEEAREDVAARNEHAASCAGLANADEERANVVGNHLADLGAIRDEPREVLKARSVNHREGGRRPAAGGPRDEIATRVALKPGVVALLALGDRQDCGSAARGVGALPAGGPVHAAADNEQVS